MEKSFRILSRKKEMIELGEVILSNEGFRVINRSRWRIIF